MAQIIALYSKAPQCGKSTIASYLADEYNAEILSFATPLRKMLLALMDYAGMEEMFYFYSNVAKEDEIPIFKASYRKLMRTLGTEWGRQLITPSIWVDLLNERLNGMSPNRVVVIDDLRFPDEYSFLRSQNAQLWKVTRSEAEIDFESTHPSDNRLEHKAFDALINNDGSIDDLEIVVDGLMSNLLTA